MNHSRKKPVKWFKNWKYITAIIIAIIALAVIAISYYQANHFNANKKINGIEVSGLTADEALEKLQTSVLKNDVYIGNELIIDGNDTQMGFTEEDLSEIKKLLKGQWTFLPSFKSKEYSLTPSKDDQYRSVSLKKELEQKLNSMNEKLQAPKDAQVTLQDGKVTVIQGIEGTQYDVASLVKDYEKQPFTSEIRLNPILIQPTKEDSEIVKDQEKKLQALLQHNVDYKVQDKVHSLKGSEVIKNASVTKDMEISIDASDLKKKIAEINNAQSTLGKNFTFKTHSGSEISVKGEGYGWALDVEKETSLVQAAFEKGEKSISASNIHGNGWNKEGYGYDIIANNGIGDTYAEVSIAEQRIWLYRDGKMVLTTNVVTGKHSTGEDTSPGVWYVLFKRTPYTLKGSAVGKPDYEVKVDYWAPFTNSGQGFHDASWRTNWNSNAYLTQGSGGCVNVSPSMMKAVYDNLSVYQPVVVY
ncbi:L,D-transpeptidase family protein [Neobacillus sp. DY30]|uniref:L,D-transpeptidase family protein n=1 Tax=Neobacillus sp. DY30 TaxID=3047871 RepID=UPI0024BFE042|nr:L,D-transpeptidase family protein [Neobacillus sp. DY30]WHY03677.1 peptidoglycan binding domain-containing protein [Neobacillus sp. DY30]